MALLLPRKERIPSNFVVDLEWEYSKKARWFKKFLYVLFWLYLTLFLPNTWLITDHDVVSWLVFYTCFTTTLLIIIISLREFLVLANNRDQVFNFEVGCFVMHSDAGVIKWDWHQIDKIHITNSGYLILEKGIEKIKVPLFAVEERESVVALFRKLPRNAYDLPTFGYFLRWFIALPIAIAIHILQFVAIPFIVNGSSMKPTLKDQNLILIDRISTGLKWPYISKPADMGYLFGPNTPDTNTLSTGDIIVFQRPDLNPGERPDKDQNKFVIKRIVAVGGDSFRFSGGPFFLNGQKLQEDYLYKSNQISNIAAKWPDRRSTKRVPPAPVERLGIAAVTAFKQGLPKSGRVPPGSLLVLGDNRDLSMDSRSKGVGFIPVQYVHGKVLAAF